jgi:hypothetical protein
MHVVSLIRAATLTLCQWSGTACGTYGAICMLASFDDLINQQLRSANQVATAQAVQQAFTWLLLCSAVGAAATL